MSTLKTKPSRSSGSSGKSKKKDASPKKSGGARKKKQSKPKPKSSPLPSPLAGVAALGLDLSLRGTGIVVVKDGAVLYERRATTGAVPPRKRPRPKGFQPDLHRFEGTQEECIDWIGRKIVYAVETFGVQLACIEGHSFNSKGMSSILHELHGVAKNRLLRLGIPFEIVAPKALKKYATGDGTASKLDMIGAAKLAGYRLVWSDDLADGYWLARHALQFPPELP